MYILYALVAARDEFGEESIVKNVGFSVNCFVMEVAV